MGPAAQIPIPPKSWDLFQPNLLCFVFVTDFMSLDGGLSGIGLYSTRIGLILRRNGFAVIINRRGVLRPIASALCIAYRFISNL